MPSRRRPFVWFTAADADLTLRTWDGPGTAGTAPGWAILTKRGGRHEKAYGRNAAIRSIVLAGCASGQRTVKDATATSATATTYSEFGETFPDEGVSSTTKPEVARKKVGETATLVETDTGREVARVLVDRVEFTKGDEFNQPERGWFLGVYVKVKALADEQTSLYGDFYVLMRATTTTPMAAAPKASSQCLTTWT
jgi:hypothetical protein